MRKHPHDPPSNSHRHREHSLSPKDARNRIVNYGRARIHGACPRRGVGSRVEDPNVQNAEPTVDVRAVK